MSEGRGALDFLMGFDAKRNMVNMCVYRELLKANKGVVEQELGDLLTGCAGTRLWVLRCMLQEALDLAVGQPGGGGCGIPFPELFLCEAVHQITLCMPCPREGRALVEEFRSRFRRQHLIASEVLGPMLSRDPRWSLSLPAKSFQTHGCVPRHVSVPDEMLAAAAAAGESTDTEIAQCLAFLCCQCILQAARGTTQRQQQPTTGEHCTGRRQSLCDRRGVLSPRRLMLQI